MRPKSLRFRLFGSYVFIIVICLAVAFAAIMIIFNPLVNRLQILRLAEQLNQISLEAKADNAGETLMSRLKEQIRGTNRRILIIARDGQVLADTDDNWPGKSLQMNPNLVAKPQRLPLIGYFTAPNGRLYPYAALQLRTGEFSGNYLLLINQALLRSLSFADEVGNGLLTAAAISFLLSLLLAVFISRSISSPINQLTRATENIKQGKYDQQVKIKGPDDFQVLADSFNNMALQVKSSQQAMRDFVLNVSHDLRTPLTSIQGFSQALLEGAAQDQDTRRRAAQIIFDESSHMMRLVNDLLDSAKIEAGQVVMRRDVIEINPIIESVITSLAPQAEQKKINFVKVFKANPSITGDGDRLFQVFHNLIDNAIKYIPSGSTIAIMSDIIPAMGSLKETGMRIKNAKEGRTTSAQAFISISDNGPGIPQEELGRIFERFYQVDKSRLHTSGSGLGLAIARQIVEAHHGSIIVESREQKGTTFTICLPISPVT
jgi:signal transduction histidine kinase